MSKKASNPFPPEGIKSDLLPPVPPRKKFKIINTNIKVSQITLQDIVDKLEQMNAKLIKIENFLSNKV